MDEDFEEDAGNKSKTKSRIWSSERYVDSVVNWPRWHVEDIKIQNNISRYRKMYGATIATRTTPYSKTQSEITGSAEFDVFVVRGRTWRTRAETHLTSKFLHTRVMSYIFCNRECAAFGMEFASKTLGACTRWLYFNVRFTTGFKQIEYQNFERQTN